MAKVNSSLMFRDLPQWLQDVLRDLSRGGWIYVGRTGVGLTYAFRKECMRSGTFKAIDETMSYHELDDKLLIELVATEGPRWVPYSRILEYCQTGVYQFVRHTGLSP